MIPVLLAANDLGRGFRVKAKPLRGRFASLDTPATARAGSYEEDGEEQATKRRTRRCRFAVQLTCN